MVIRKNAQRRRDLWRFVITLLGTDKLCLLLSARMLFNLKSWKMAVAFSQMQSAARE